jgi:heme exporter protein A
VLEAASVDCERGGKVLFRALSFTLRGGELLRIAGANGRGKTSLLRILCGLALPDSGEVRWQGGAIRQLREEYSRQLIFIGHASALKDELTAEENLRIACTLAGMRVPDTSIQESLKRFGVDEKSPVKQLSQGQRRRAVLARLLLGESIPLWLLDEPFAALDASASKLAENLIAQHVARGCAVIYTTHQEANIPAAAARVVDLGAGP